MTRKFKLSRRKSASRNLTTPFDRRFFPHFVLFYVAAVVENMPAPIVCTMATLEEQLPCFYSHCQIKVAHDCHKIDVNWLKRLGFDGPGQKQLVGKPICTSCFLFGQKLWEYGFNSAPTGRPRKRTLEETLEEDILEMDAVDADDSSDHEDVQQGERGDAEQTPVDRQCMACRDMPFT